MAWEAWDSKLICTDFSERVVGRGHDLPLPFDLKKPAEIECWWSDHGAKEMDLTASHPSTAMFNLISLLMAEDVTLPLLRQVLDNVTRESLSAFVL